LVEQLGEASHTILIEVSVSVGWRLPKQPLDLKLHLPSVPDHIR
jgi:hypothetical protein